MRDVDGTCGPRQKSMKFGPSVYSEKISSAFSSMSSHLHPVVGVFLQAVGLLRQLALIRQIPGLDLCHARFDSFEILGRKRRLALEVVIEAGVGGRPDAELGLGKQFEHRRRQQVSSRVPVNLERFRILRSQNLNFGVFFERPGQIVQLSIHARHHGVVGQARADRLGDVQRAAPGRRGRLAAIGQSNG